MSIGWSALVLAASVGAQSNPPTQDPRATRASEGAAAARGPQLGEGNPIPDPKPRYSAEERAAAHAARRGKAPPTKAAAPKSAPAPIPKWGSPERAAARAAQREEATRANKAGDIKSKGETSN